MSERLGMNDRTGFAITAYQDMEKATMRKDISFYYQRIEGIAGVDDLPGLIDLHTESFRQHGWNVVLLDESVARQHPLYDVFNNENSVFATSRNGWEYTRACYMRWLAYASARTFYADFDVINYGFTFEDALDVRELAGGPTFLSGAGAMGLFENDQYEEILDTFLDYAKSPFIEGMLTTDVNDMNILLQCRPDLFSLIGTTDTRIARDYSCPGWDVAQLVHYPYHYTKAPRSNTIRAERPIDGLAVDPGATGSDPAPETEDSGITPSRNHGMLRADINNRLLGLFKNPSYLEIGVWRGDTFRQINAQHKVAVDPDFQFDFMAPENNGNNEEYFQVTSNEYFTEHASDSKFDVIFLDGLHTFEQTLTDLLHAIDRVKEGGFIVIDDVIPDSYPASMRSEAECYYFRQSINDSSTHWMGDVYKLVFFISSFLLNWTYFTVEETHGQVVMWRKSRVAGQAGDERAVQICSKSYSDVVLQKDIFNLKPLDQIISAANVKTA